MINLVPEPADEILESASLNPEMLEDDRRYYTREQLEDIFKETLEKANQLVSSWNGKLYFVYLPSGSVATDDKKHPWREFVLNTATELGIPILDIESTVFAPHDDPASLFPFRNSGYHYNAKGYRLVAEAIAERLQADGGLQ